MKSKIIKVPGILLLGIVAFISMNFSCNRDQCKDVICTSILKMIIVQVVDNEGMPVILDEFYTIRNKTGEKIVLENRMMEGRYNVMDDTYLKNLINSTEDFTFVGIKDGNAFINEPYRISADCCHINKESGKEKIII